MVAVRIYWFVLFLISTPFISFGKDDGKYSVKNIPDSLKENAHAVISKHKSVFEIKSTKRAVKEVKMAITILNHNGQKFANFYKQYDNFSKLRGVTGSIYNGAGEKIKNIRRSDIKDIDKYSRMSLYEDTQVKYFRPTLPEFPVTVVYEYKIKYNGLLNYPDWIPQYAEHLSIENASFKVTVDDPEINFRFKEFNSHQFSKKIKEKRKHEDMYLWTIQNCKAYVEESYGPNTVRSYAPVVYIAPGNFSIEGYEGNMTSWQSFGKWFYQLNKDRKELSQQTTNHVLNMVNNIDDPVTKIKKVYEYMQSKTRYVSIQLGIGGWQPFEASVVDQKNYGDCKALTNYMQAMLQVVGIKSYYSLVKAGKNETELIKDFPSNQFNHVILCVPLESDTIWLECTNNRSPFNYLGHFTEDRNVLMVTEEGGTLMKTPEYGIKNCKTLSKAIIKIKENGQGKLKLNKKAIGLAYEKWRSFIYKKPSEQKKWLYQNLPYKNFSVDDFEYNLEKQAIPKLHLNYRLSMKNFASVSGKRIFLPTSVKVNQFKVTPSKNSRNQPLVIEEYENKIDSITYRISRNWEIEHSPENVSIQTLWGTFERKISRKKDSLIIYKHYTLKKGSYSPHYYREYVTFIKKINKAENDNIVLLKQ